VALADFMPSRTDFLYCVGGLGGVKVALADFLSSGADLLHCVGCLRRLRWP
jgi:hypothetical protein